MAGQSLPAAGEGGCVCLCAVLFAGLVQEYVIHSANIPNESYFSINWKYG